MADSTHLEIGHMQLQAAAEQSQNLEMFVLAHVSAYDPATARCKVIYPTYTDNTNMNYVESGWINIATPWSGSGFGDQVAPYGGATINDLTGQTNNPNANPEQCIVMIVSREGTFHVMGAFLCNQTDLPPGSNQTFVNSSGASQLLTISQGERVIRHSSGTYIYFKQDGSINIIATTSPHNPFKEPDPQNLVRQVNVQAVSGVESSNSQQSAPTSITSQVQSSARSTGSGAVQNVTAVNEDMASASSGDNANATYNNTVTSTGQSASNSTATIDVIALGEGTNTAVGNITINAANGTATLSLSATGQLNTINISAPDNGTVNINAKNINIIATDLLTLIGGNDTMVLGATP